MEEVLHIEDLEWWCDKLDALRATRHELVKRYGYHNAPIGRIDTKIADIENKITQIENLKQND